MKFMPYQLAISVGAADGDGRCTRIHHVLHDLAVDETAVDEVPPAVGVEHNPASAAAAIADAHGCFAEPNAAACALDLDGGLITRDRNDLDPLELIARAQGARRVGVRKAMSTSECGAMSARP